MSKVQNRRLSTLSRGQKPSAEFEKSYEKHRKKIVELVRTVHINANRIEQLKLSALRPQPQADDARRQAAAAGRGLPHPAPGLPRQLPDARDRPATGSTRSASCSGKGWKDFAKKKATDVEKLRGRDQGDLRHRRRADLRVPPHVQDRAGRRARDDARQEGDDRGQPAPRDLDRQEVHQPRPAVPRPDPGRQHRPDEGGRQVRVPPRLQVLDLRHVVDPSGDHPLDRRPGAHHPHPGAHDRDHQQAGPHQPPDAARDRPRAAARGAGREARHAAREGAQGAEDRQGADQPRDADRRRGGFSISATSSRTRTR